MAEEAEPEIDPAWWRDVLAAADTDAETRMLEMGRLIMSAAQEATDKPSADVLRVLAVGTSAMLRPERWNEPFEPAWAFDGRRGPLPSDLGEEDLVLLRRIAHLMDETDNPSLRGRVCDVGWLYGGRADIALLDAAISAYTAVPLTREAWNANGAEEWKRALELAIRRGADGAEQIATMADALIDCVRTAEGTSGYFGVNLSELIRERRLATKDEAEDMAALCVQHADEAREARSWHIAQGWEQEAVAWFRALNLRDDVSAAQVRLAECFAAEAEDRRQGVGGAATSASHFVDLALKTLREIPRSYRAAHSLDERIEELRQLLLHDREVLLASMVPIRTEPVDLSEQAADARRRVNGQGQIAALGALAAVFPQASYQDAVKRAREGIQQHPLSALFGGETYDSSGQKVSMQPGANPATVSGGGEPDEVTWSAMIRDHGILTTIVVNGRIMPALELVRLQHQYSAALLFDVCRHSPYVPSGREWTWARGLLHGLDGDFVSAVCVLVPQIEHFARGQMKQAGVHTLVTDERGVENEKGLSALLDDARSTEVLGPDLRFELRALLTASQGPNLRNVIAHGLASDGHLLGHAAVYAWWQALRIAVLPWAAQTPNEASDEDADGESDTEGQK